jgi:hypothetical protein
VKLLEETKAGTTFGQCSHEGKISLSEVYLNIASKITAAKSMEPEPARSKSTLPQVLLDKNQGGIKIKEG